MKPNATYPTLTHLPDGTILFIVNKLYAELKEDGWHWFIQSDHDPRRSIPQHPCNNGDVWELSNYPIFLGKTDGIKAPDNEAVQLMNEQYKEARRALSTPHELSYTDTLLGWVDRAITIDDWAIINQRFAAGGKETSNKQKRHNRNFPRKMVRPALLDPANGVDLLALFDADRQNEHGGMYCVQAAISPNQVDSYWDLYLDYLDELEDFVASSL